MRATLNKFIAEIEQLEKYVLVLSQINTLVRYSPTNDDTQFIKENISSVKSQLNTFSFKKVLEYNSIIVSMYGFFERFIEDILTDYLEIVCSYIPKYQELPKSILDNHPTLTAQLIQSLKFPKYSNENINLISSRLNICLNEDKSDLNLIAFTEHSSNFKAKSIGEFFKRVEVNNINNKIKLNPSFANYLITERLGPNVNLSQIEDEVVFFILTDLAQRRNDISHGSNNGSPILNNSVLPEYFTFLKRYATAISEILSLELLKYECISNFQEVKLEAIFNRNILCIEAKNTTLKLNDRILVRKGREDKISYFERIILGIQIDGIQVPSIVVGETPVKIGFQLDNPVKENQTFFTPK